MFSAQPFSDGTAAGRSGLGVGGKGCLMLLPPLKEMMHRSVAVADLISGAGGNRPVHERLGLMHGSLNVVSLGQIGGNGR
jgi:hypothetical protein